MELILQLAGGALGGNIAGALFKKLSLGTLLNSLAGILGGGIGGQLLGMLGLLPEASGGSLDLSSILATLGGSTVGGGGLMAIVGLVKSLLGGGQKA